MKIGTKVKVLEKVSYIDINNEIKNSIGLIGVVKDSIGQFYEVELPIERITLHGEKTNKILFLASELEIQL